MTHVIKVRNVNYAVEEGFYWLKVAGVREQSRNGPVRVAPGPVVTEYTHPTERVLFNADRDANAVFHLLESIWMLAGQDKVDFLLPYNARMAFYAEDNGAIHGAYGYRWRKMFGLDQILEIIRELRTTPSSRQCVMQMWSSAADLGVQKRDRPCNTHIYFDCRGGVLNMTVSCRSNDALWGAYGANVVHFSVLQEFIAYGVGVPVGIYRQFSNNFHAYEDVEIAAKWLDLPPSPDLGYYPQVIPLLDAGEALDHFLVDCMTLTNPRLEQRFLTTFFNTVVVPLKTAYDLRKVGNRTWRAQLDHVAECDWKLAFIQWAERREHVSK